MTDITINNADVEIKRNDMFILPPQHILVNANTVKKISGLATIGFGWLTYSSHGDMFPKCMCPELTRTAAIIFGAYATATAISGLAFCASVICSQNA